MSRIYNYEGPVFTFLSKLADLFWLNLLFIICCIPVITIGASTTALYYVTLKMAKDEEGYITRSYFKSFKENIVQATAIWLGILVAAVILLMDLRVVNSGNITEAFNSSMPGNIITVAVFVMGIVLLMICTYVFPILAQFDNSIKNTVKNSFLISIRHLPYTVLIQVITVLPVVFIWLFPVMLLLVLILFSATAYINSRFYNKIFKLYMPKDYSDPAGELNGENGEE